MCGGCPILGIENGEPQVIAVISAVAENSGVKSRYKRREHHCGKKAPCLRGRPMYRWTQGINKAWRARLDRLCSSNSAVRANVRSSDGIGPESFWIVSRPVVIALSSMVFNA